LARLKGGKRRITRISEIEGLDPAPYRIRDIFGFRKTGVEQGAAVGEFFATGDTPVLVNRLKASGIELPATLFERRTIPA
jgi:pilus assembly protein CpaF